MIIIFICVSVVSKEMGEDGKEDLKLDTVSVTIEGQDNEDPALKIPGKLLLWDSWLLTGTPRTPTYKGWVASSALVECQYNNLEVKGHGGQRFIQVKLHALLHLV